MVRSDSILRRHRAAQKVYVPNDARDNQYVIAEMPLTDKLIELVAGDIDLTADKPYQRFYQKLAKLSFDVVEELGIAHAKFVANSRLVRVRHGNEQQVLHTPQQSYFFYCPEHNSTFKGYFDGAHRSNKIKFVFLANGKDIRLSAADLHQKAHSAAQMIAERIGLAPGDLKLRDHQHLTYDLFAKEKGNKDTITHNFRDIATRYRQQGYDIKGDHSDMTYAIVSIPMTRRLIKGTTIDYDQPEPFAPLYNKIADAFTNATANHKLTHTALIANGMSTIVRYDEEEKTVVNGEIISLGFNPQRPGDNTLCEWEGDKLVDTIRLVFFATKADETNKTYGKFINKVHQAVNTFAQTLNWKKDHDDMIVRLHQHLIRRV